MTRRPSAVRVAWLGAAAAAAVAVCRAAGGEEPVNAAAEAKGARAELRVWAFGDAHVGTDLRRKRESLAEAIRQSESGGTGGAPAFDWDLALDVGDNSGGQDAPRDDEGRELVRQFAALAKHAREQVYSVCGNHDRSHLSEPEAWWFRKWVDPMGESTAFSGVDPARRPYPVGGTWERYAFRAGNILFLMMSDINEPSQKVGRGDLGGNPGGVVRAETFEWWRRMVEANPDAIIVTVHHYMLKNTTTASGPWEGMIRRPDGTWESGYHGYKEKGTPEGASYLYVVGGVKDSGAFERYLEAHPGSIALWLGGHTHPHNPDDEAGGKPLVATRWGVHFINVCPLTKHHVGARSPTTPMSRLLTFTESSSSVRVQCYLHTADHAKPGWYGPAERTLELARPYRR